MKRRQFVETQNGQRHLLEARKRRRRHVLVDQPLRGKGSMKAPERIAFQRQLLESMQVLRQRPLLRGVVLELDFSTAQPNPPEPQSLAKNYIDLLFRPDRALGTRRRALWFLDDRQVDILAVAYGPSTEGSSIFATASPLRDFQADLDLLDRVRRADFGDAERSPWVDEEEEQVSHHQAFDELLKFRRDDSFWRQRLSDEGYEGMLDFHRIRAQEEILQRNDRLLEQALVRLLSRDMSRFSFGDALQKAERRILLTEPISLDLGNTPQEEGDSALFKERVRTALTEFRDRWNGIMFPLRTLLATSLLVVPPAQGRGTGVDLDNLARKIIPEVHSIMRPPSTISRARRPSRDAGEKLTTFWEKHLEAERRFPNYSVTRYTAVRLPRIDNDPEEGFVSLMFGDGLPGAGLLSRIEQRLDKWERSLRQR